MSTLGKVQRNFRDAILNDAEDGIAGLILDDGLTPAERLAVYRNNVMASLTAALKETFPVICRLVDERFFDYAAHEFIRSRPPQQPCLTTYGADFPAFLGKFPPCVELVYLADTARLEWLMHEAATAAEAAPLAPSALGAFAPEDTGRLVFHLHPSIRHLASPWPIDRIWRENQADAEGEGSIDIGAGGVRLELRRRGMDVVYRRLAPASFAFRRALARGETLERAFELASGEDGTPPFDLAAALAELFRDEAVVGLAIASAEWMERKS
ncbi:MAG TPA: DNA-binding domain-containing protein [Alphaproteobacteria bacterium]|nr:DNA-binding domain-containing protein [Alphaproteobacteria bacterium]